MREIEFRGKLISNGKWAYGNLDIKKTGTAIITPDETVLGAYGKVIPETVGQYTGLKDKNGKKIYEGDIIEYKEIYSKGLVEYSEKYAQYVLKETGQIANEYEPLGDYNMKVYEVIGNIYDNPEELVR